MFVALNLLSYIESIPNLSLETTTMTSLKNFGVALICITTFGAAACSSPKQRSKARDAAEEEEEGAGGAVAGRGGSNGSGGMGRGGSGMGGTAVGMGGVGMGGMMVVGAGGTMAMGGARADAGVDRVSMDMPRPTADVGTARPPSTDVNQMTADTACTKLATAVCNKIKTCTNGFVVERDYGTDANCIVEQKASCINGVNYPWSGDNAMRANACATAAEAQTCTDYLAGVILTACHIGPGRIEVGGACLSARQCASSFCRVPGDAVCGVCEAKADDGATCDTNEQCPSGSVCGGGMCTKPVALGAACSGAMPCGAGLACVGVSGSPDRKCEKLLVAQNAPCDPARITLPSCDSRLGFYCKVAPSTTGGVASVDAGANDAGVAAITGKCEKITFAGAGMSCGTNALDAVRVDCRGGIACRRLVTDAGGSDRATVGICVADVAANAACDTNTAMGPTCQIGLRCVQTASGMTAGTCKPRIQSACMP